MPPAKYKIGDKVYVLGWASWGQGEIIKKNKDGSFKVKLPVFEWMLEKVKPEHMSKSRRR